MSKSVRIGCGAGFWGDSAEGPKQLVESGEIDYLVLDYLAEITMSLLAKARGKDPAAGYATDFPDVIARLAPTIKANKIRVVTNAGGVNPQACRDALQAKLQAAGIELSIGIVTGDDLLARAGDFANVKEMFTGESIPGKLWSMNAYLGAFPVAQALDAGADIVITGRCVDSAVVLGPLIHEFGWKTGDYDQLAMGSLAGHIVECGAQATGGILTDWETTCEDWDRMGFPIAICEADGSFVVTKPANTGGNVNLSAVGEQLIYEIGDPASYLLPDVTCDFRSVTLTQLGDNRVQVLGAKGRAPSDQYKVSATYQDGFRATGTMMIGGRNAVGKAEAVAAAILRRTRHMFEQRKLPDYTRTDVEVLGSESNWGANARRRDTREVVLKLSVQSADKNALEIFSREFIPAATAMAQSITGFSGGRPSVTPVVRLFSCLVPKSSLPVNVDAGGKNVSAPIAAGVAALAAAPAVAIDNTPVAEEGTSVSVPLVALAYGRSGDKGNSANIGVIARRAEFVSLLREQLTAEAVKQYMAHFFKGEAQRFELPGLMAFNFLFADALGGGGMASLRYDPQGKMLAQILMDFPLSVPKSWVDKGLVSV